MEPGLEETAVYDPPNFSWPGGCHIAVVEVDTETGDTRLVRYVAVDDVGNVINPMIVDGQVHGGIAQGVAPGALRGGGLRRRREPRSPARCTYLVPSAAELPSFELDREVTPEPDEPDGREGRGGDRDDRLDRRGDERRRRRARAVRRHRHRHARLARASLARDPGGADDPRSVRLRGRRLGRARDPSCSARGTTRSCSRAATRCSR